MSDVDIDFQLLIRMIDECLIELGTASLVDGRQARDKLLDIRSIVAAMVDEEDVPVPERIG